MQPKRLPAIGNHQRCRNRSRSPRPHHLVPMNHPLSERQQVKLLLQTTTPSTTISALKTPISPTHYLTWSTARRRAWDKRQASPNSYFIHYLHPTLSPRPKKWSLEEHHIFLAALRRAPPSDQWGLFSLLVPGRIGSECRRYYHRIGRAGFITLDGKVRNRLVSKAQVMDEKNVLESNNPLFLRRSLRKFVPGDLPQIDDTLYKSLEKPSPKKRSMNKACAGRPNRDPGKRKNLETNRDAKGAADLLAKSKTSEKLSSDSAAKPLAPLVDVQDMLTYVPAKPSDYDCESPSNDSHVKDCSTTATAQAKLEAVPCLLRIRDSNERRVLSLRPSSVKTRAPSNSRKHVVFQSMSRRIGDGLGKAGSIKVKIRTNLPKLASSSAKNSRLPVTVEPHTKCEVSHKNRKVKKSDQKSLKYDTSGEEENQIPSQPQPTSRLRNLQNSPKRAKATEFQADLKKRGEFDIGKSDAVRLSLSHDEQAGGHLTKLNRKSVKPLKPILKLKEAPKKRRENTKTVHFSQTEEEGKEASALKELLRDKGASSGKYNSDVYPVVFSLADQATGQTSRDGKFSSNHEIDLEINKNNDTSGYPQETSAFSNTPSIPSDSGSINHVAKRQAAVGSSIPVSCRLDNRPRTQLFGKEAGPVEVKSFSPRVLSWTPSSNSAIRQVQMGSDDMPLADDLDRGPNSDQKGGRMPSVGKTTPESLHVGSCAVESSENPFEDKSRKSMEIDQREQSAFGNDSRSIGTDGELLDIGVGMDTPLRNQTENVENLQGTGDLGSKRRNPRRVSGPTKEDRTSISFLMNGSGSESPRKKRKREDDASSVDCGVSRDFERSVSLVPSGRDVTRAIEDGCNEFPVGKGSSSVLNDAGPNVDSEYQVMQTRVEQTRLLLRLFADIVDPIGEQLGHKGERLRLLESYDEALQWVHFNEGQAAKKRPLSIPSLSRAAKTAFELDNRRAWKKHHTVHVGGLTSHWGACVDSYIEHLKEMETRQNMEVESKRSADSVC